MTRHGRSTSRRIAALVGALGAAFWLLPGEPTTGAVALAEQPPAQAAPAHEATAPADGDPAAALFVQKCAGCHTVGRGRLTGPDLNEASAWQSPDLDRAIKTMESKAGPLPDDQVAALRDLLKAPDVRDRLEAEQKRATRQSAAALEPASADVGAALFDGRKPLTNGGLACVACHTAGDAGGTLGPDLSGVFDKLGEAPLVSACEKTNYRIMSAAYRDHPVTKQEALHLVAFFSTRTAEPPRPANTRFALFGVAGAALMLGAVGLIYRGRRPGRMRQRLARRRKDVVD